MSEQNPKTPPVQQPPPKRELQPVKAQAQATSSKPDKDAPVPKYILLANERIENE